MQSVTTHKHKGFTLIELVVVIIVLVVLAVTALPKFINLADDAYLARFNATQGAFESAMKQAHAKWLTSGSPAPANATDLIEALDFNSLGYPAGTDNGTQVSSEADCKAIFDSLLQLDGMTTAIPAGDGPGIKNLPVEVDWAVTNNSNICYYTYVPQSREVGFNARQLRYYYTTGEYGEFAAGYTLQ